MSDYQVTNYGMCGECKWHEYHKRREWVCENEDSECFGWITLYDDRCDCFEQRGIE